MDDVFQIQICGEASGDHTKRVCILEKELKVVLFALQVP